jgi:alpha-L-fucosidase
MAVSEELREAAERLRALRFGMFTCWSLSTFSDREWTRDVTDVEFFSPGGFEPRQWCETAKAAGMGYLLLLSKHHDGFCLWDTDTTDFKVTNSPLGTDVLAAVREECDRAGLGFALYFSEGDWTWEDYRNNPEVKKAQLSELCSRYGEVLFFWMDHAQSDGGLDHVATSAWVKRHQPRCLVGFNHGQAAGEIRLGEMGKPGDIADAAGAPYADRTESEDFLLAEFSLPILGMERWFYTNPDNDDRCRGVEELAELYRGAEKYGNIFNLDVGPDRNGRLRPIDEATLRRVGREIAES